MAKATSSASSRTAATKTTPKTATVKTTTVKKTRASAKSTAKAPHSVATPRTAPAKAAPIVVTETAVDPSIPEMKKPELVDAAVVRSGIKKKYTKPAIEAALAIIGETLAEGRGLNLRPLGKVKIQRIKDVANGKVITVRVRQPLEKPVASEGFTDPDEGL